MANIASQATYALFGAATYEPNQSSEKLYNGDTGGTAVVRVVGAGGIIATFPTVKNISQIILSQNGYWTIYGINIYIDDVIVASSASLSGQNKWTVNLASPILGRVVKFDILSVRSFAVIFETEIYDVIAPIGVIVNTDTSRQISTTENINADTKRIITNVIPLTVNADTLRVVSSHQTINADMMRKTSVAITNSTDTERMITDNATLIPITIGADTLRCIYAPVIINADTLRRIPRTISSDIGIKSITIQSGVQALADRVVIESVGEVYSGTTDFYGSFYGFAFSYDKAIVGESRTAMGTTYTVTSKPDLERFLKQRVYIVTGSYVYNGGRVINKTAKQLCALYGITANITDFTPLGIGTYSENTHNFTIKESSLNSLLNKLFGWTSEFGTRQIYYTLRNGIVEVNEIGRYTKTYNLDDDTKYRVESANITRQQMIKFLEVDSNTETATVTKGSSVITVNYSNTPFSGITTFGESSLTYATGLITRETNADSTTIYEYETADSFSFEDANKVLKTKTTTNASGNKKTVTTYEYDVVKHGAYVSADLDVSLLSEHTINTSIDSSGNENTDSEHIVTHTPLGNGFFGQLVEEIGDDGRTTVSHSISRGSPGGLASLYTLKTYSGYSITTDPNVIKPIDFDGELKSPVNIPVAEIPRINELIGIVNNMNRKIEERINLSVMVKPGAELVDVLKGAIIYDGNLYYIQSTSAVINEKSVKNNQQFLCRQQISAVRWF